MGHLLTINERSPEESEGESFGLSTEWMVTGGQKDSWVEIRMWLKVTGWLWTRINNILCQGAGAENVWQAVEAWQGGDVRRFRGPGIKRRGKTNLQTIGYIGRNGNWKTSWRMGRTWGLEGRKEGRKEKVNFPSVLVYHLPFLLVYNLGPISLVERKNKIQ